MTGRIPVIHVLLNQFADEKKDMEWRHGASAYS
jgi:hypothetical protein